MKRESTVRGASIDGGTGLSIKVSDLPPRYQNQAARKYFAQSRAKAAKTVQEPRERTSKYNNTKTFRNAAEGAKIKFDSKAEAAHFDELMARQKAGLIRNLKLQPEYTLQEAFTTTEGERIQAIRYRADFSYEERQNLLAEDGEPGSVWVSIVEDVKGKKTDVYNLKKKMMQEKYGVTIREVS